MVLVNQVYQGTPPHRGEPSDDDFLTEHVWLSLASAKVRGFKLEQGATILFEGRVAEYHKGEDRSLDFCFDKAKIVRVISCKK